MRSATLLLTTLLSITSAYAATGTATNTDINSSTRTYINNANTDVNVQKNTGINNNIRNRSINTRVLEANDGDDDSEVIEPNNRNDPINNNFHDTNNEDLEVRARINMDNSRNVTTGIHHR